MLGQVIHGYRIDRALSEDKGGFGDVYFATHVDSGAEAVVKVLKPEMSALRDIVARFFNEARAAARFIIRASSRFTTSAITATARIC
ncbi:MAG TPA: hypothetical protein VGD80_06575 [Kofleriaceae bacterium]